MPEAEAALPEVVGQRVHEFGVQGTWGQGVLLAGGKPPHPVEVEGVVWLHEGDRHQFAPGQVHGGARELRVFGEHTRQFVPRVLSRAGRLPGQQEGGLVSEPLETGEASLGEGVVRRVVSGVVPLRKIVHEQIHHHVLRPIVPGSDLPGIAHERRVPVELFAGPLREPLVQRLEVCRTVVAGEARGVDAKEDPGNVHVELVDRVQPVVDGVVVQTHDDPALDLVRARQQRQRRNAPVRLGHSGDEVAHHLVIGPVGGEPLLDPALERVADRAYLVGEAEEIPEEPRPLLREFIRTHQFVHEPRPFVARVVGEERADCFRRGNESRGVEHGAPEEGRVGTRSGVGDSQRLLLRPEDLVHQGAPWKNLADRVGGGVRAARQPAGGGNRATRLLVRGLAFGGDPVRPIDQPILNFLWVFLLVRCALARRWLRHRGKREDQRRSGDQAYAYRGQHRGVSVSEKVIVWRVPNPGQTDPGTRQIRSLRPPKNRWYGPCA